MKPALILIFVVCMTKIGFTQNEVIEESNNYPIENEGCCPCSEFPYPGGQSAFLSYFTSHPLTIATNISITNVKCYTQFIIQEDGSLTNIEVLKSVPNCAECERACVKLLEEMPAWIPQNYHGIPKDYMIHLPIRIAFQPN